VSERHFTLEEANELVPRVHAVMHRLLQLQSHLRVTSRALLQAGVRVAPDEPGREVGPNDDPKLRLRVQQARGILEAVRETMAEIEVLGAQVKDVERGLVDFPTLLDGTREVLLCWRIGEPTITHWHEVEAGFDGRKSVVGHRFTNAPRVLTG